MWLFCGQDKQAALPLQHSSLTISLTFLTGILDLCLGQKFYTLGQKEKVLSYWTLARFYVNIFITILLSFFPVFYLPSIKVNRTILTGYCNTLRSSSSYDICADKSMLGTALTIVPGTLDLWIEGLSTGLLQATRIKEYCQTTLKYPHFFHCKYFNWKTMTEKKEMAT